MTENTNRRDLKAAYRDSAIDAGVYRILNEETGQGLVGSTTNLRSVKSRLDFAKSTNSPGAFDLRLKEPIRKYGLDAFSFEVLEALETPPEATTASVRTDLATLEQLWREKLGPEKLY